MATFSDLPIRKFSFRLEAVLSAQVTRQTTEHFSRVEPIVRLVQIGTVLHLNILNLGCSTYPDDYLNVSELVSRQGVSHNMQTTLVRIDVDSKRSQIKLLNSKRVVR